jgi:TolA-binding protein
LLILSLSGCALFKEKETVRFKMEAVQKDRSPNDHSESLLLAKRLLERQDFDGALKENQKVLALSGMTPPGDEALFNMGLVYAHFGNPKKDYGKSQVIFKKLLKDYPQSLMAEQAKIWIGILQENEKLNQTVQKLHQTLEEAKKVDIEIEEKKREKAK